jgi:hypothetical protein
MSMIAGAELGEDEKTQVGLAPARIRVDGIP